MNEQQPVQTSGIEVNEVVPAPKLSTLAAPQFQELSSPLDLLMSKDPTNHYDVTTGQAIGTVPLDTKFQAVGKYETGKTTYYTDGRLNISTTDLKPDPNPETAEDPDEQKVEVRIDKDPNAWMRSLYLFKGGPARYEALDSINVYDIAKDPITETHPEFIPLDEGDVKEIAGSFNRGGVDYFISKNTLDAGFWYGIPETAVRPYDDEDADLIAATEELRINSKTAAIAGTAAGLAARFKRKV